MKRPYGRIYAISFTAIILSFYTIAPSISAQAIVAPAPPVRGGQTLPVVQRGLSMIDQLQAGAGELRLSVEQRPKFDAIFQSARVDLRGLVPQLLQVQPPARRQQVLAFLNTLPEKINPVLTSEQIPKFQQEFAKVRERFAAQPQQVRAPAPASQPAEAPRLGVLLERLNDYVNKVDLTDEQKPQVNKLFANSRQELLDLRSGVEALTPAMQQKSQEIIQDLRQQLAAILTPAQAEHLRDLISAGGLTPEAPAMASDAMMGGMAAGAAQGVAKKAPDTAALPDAPLIDVGQNAPDFQLKRVDGAMLQLSSLKGHFVLLVFGSYSSPSFRQRAAALDQIRMAYGLRLSPFIVYTQENYPAGQWNVDRNKDDGISIEQPADMEGRIANARKAHDNLKLTVPILADTMDDTVAKAYGGFTNAAVLIDKNGRVVARQKWLEPYALRKLIDEAMRQPAGIE